MTKYQKYAEYKDSGVEALGLIPKGWSILRGKFLFKEINERSESGEETLLSVSEYYGVKPREEKIADGDFLTRAESLEGYKKCYPNDLVMNIMLAWKRGLGVSKYEGIVSPAYSVFRFSEQVNSDYIHYLLRTEEYTKYFKTRSTGIIDSRLRLYPESFGDIFILFPTLEIQTQIANFLDYETAKIDTLIAKQEELIALLKEKRQAVISHAVTKGLNPNVPMKDSGVEWLGQVPEHWKFFNIQRVLNFIEQGSSPVAQNQTPQDDEYGVLKISAIKKGKFFPNESKTLDYKSQLETKYIVHLGDLLVTRANTPQLVADTCVVNTEPTFPTMMCDLIYRLNTTSDIKKEFLCYWLLSNSGRTQIELDARGSSMTMAKVSQSHIKAWKVVLPPLKEQNDIVIYLDYKLKEIDRLIDKSMVTIKLIQERRTALISAAVTGKIDVRNWQNPNKNNEANMELSA
ncbi:restriction endonuclease subunit S [Acinetobacter soli]|uniref:Type I restriction modification DNA specificity domain-containing protein n=1 Tax=Acinetobacter soli TaxID=487316 RepID=A0A1P8EKF8_9GAMM|nr:restriction endonuclease subunit S [Acinetobacter soli]APV36706.1 hypothetical protein BEN76_12050 [Acinetobacter soli]